MFYRVRVCWLELWIILAVVGRMLDLWLIGSSLFFGYSLGIPLIRLLKVGSSTARIKEGESFARMPV
jgi:hypothetical protein